MNTNNLLWVLGHKIRLLDTDESYGMIEVTSPPQVPGPPPHFHKSEREFFFIIQGMLNVMANGEWQKYSAGSFVELPPNTTHTFINNTEQDVVWDWIANKVFWQKSDYINPIKKQPGALS